jgi:hypothetical protein
VKPFVDGTVLTTVQLIQAAWGSLDGQTTFEDARSCRETMSAYATLAAAGSEVTLRALDAECMKVKKEHRGVYDSQRDQLMAILEMPQTDKQKRNAQITENRAQAKSIRSVKTAACEKKRESQIRSARNKRVSGSAEGKANAKARKKKFTESMSKEEYNSSNKRRKRAKDNHEHG